MGSDALQISGAARGGSIRSINQRLSNNSDMIVLMDSDLNIDRSRSFKEGIIGSRSNAELSGYIHAYGWSLPASSVKLLTNATSADSSPSGNGSSQKVSTILGGTSSHMTATDPLPLQSSNSADVVSGSLSFNKSQSSLNIPIPQYCRPLTGDSLGMKIWCATTIDLSGGEVSTNDSKDVTLALKSSLTNVSQTRDPDSSGSIVNISSSTPIKSPNQQALKNLEREVDDALNDNGNDTIEDAIEKSPTKRLPTLKTTTEMVMSALPFSDDAEELSTCVWICSTQHSRSKITIIDMKTKPNELLDSFYVSTFLYCIKSVPGCKTGDLLGITSSSQQKDNPQKSSITLAMINELIQTQKREFYRLIEVDLDVEHKLRLQAKRASSDRHESSTSSQQNQEIKSEPSNDDDAEISRILDNNVSVGIATLQKLNDFVAHIQPQADTDEVNEHQKQSTSTSDNTYIHNQEDRCKDLVYYQPISTCLSTVWMGGKDSVLYIHSAIGQWKDCVACVKLRDSILQICHFRGRVFVALADGSLCVFFRNNETKQWEFSQYLLIDINLMVEVTNDLVDLAETGGTVDLQSKLVSDASTASDEVKETSTSAQSDASLTEQLQRPITNQQARHGSVNPIKNTSPNKSPRSKVAGIRCLEIANKNLWVGHRNRILIMDPVTLKLKHTFNVVPQVDNQIRQLISMKDGVFCCLRSDLILRLYSSLKPYQHIQNIDIEPIVTRLISPRTFVISHITAMKVTDNTLWIGNAHGIILTIPCKLLPQISEAPIRSNSRSGESEELSSSLSIARYVPMCDISNVQVSFDYFILFYR